MHTANAVRRRREAGKNGETKPLGKNPGISRTRQEPDRFARIAITIIARHGTSTAAPCRRPPRRSASATLASASA
jgi:hypothetical protein